MDLEGKIAVVTGASSGLGKAISSALIAKGSTVYGLARNKEKLNEIQDELGSNFIPVVMDITDFSLLKSWVKDSFASKDIIPDILVNNAGVGGFAKIDEMPSEDWFSMINTNLNAVYQITSELVKLMKQTKGGSHIINIGSILGTTTRTEAAAYCATKYGINGMSEVLFKELRSDNIKVTVINSGSIETDFFKTSGIESHGNMLQAKDIADTIVHVLETPANVLINELTIRPLDSRKRV